MASAAGIRRPILAGLIVGCVLAFFHNHFDEMRLSHEENPFAHHNNGGHLGNHWERRAFASEHAVITEERAASTLAAVNVAVEVNPPLNNNDGGSPGPGKSEDGATAGTTTTVASFSAAAVSTFKGGVVKPLKLQYPDPFKVFKGCKPELPQGGAPRKLDLIAPADSPDWPVDCVGHEELCDILRRVAVNREVLAAVANIHAPGIFEFVDGIKKLGVKNFLVIALDDVLHQQLGTRGVASYRVHNSAQGSHKVSAQKFGIIQEFVERGCSVLLTDTDVAYLQNPFPYLYRDSDIESMSDGWDNSSAHGFFDRVDDPAMGHGRRRARAFRIAALNSGMWLVMATRASQRLMAIMAHRMATEDLWDQAGYNLELWFGARDGHGTAGATVRVMHPLCFVNSKVMFRFIRHTPALAKEKHLPVAMHANYHTDKANKMKMVYEYYTRGRDISALNCGVGCGTNLKTVHELESKVLHSINDGIVGSKKWTDGKEGVWPGVSMSSQRITKHAAHCKPVAPWGGKITAAPLTRALHTLPRAKTAEACVVAGGGAGSQKDEWAAAVCEALMGLDPEAPEVMLVAVDSDASSIDAMRSLLSRGVARLNLQRRVLLVAPDADVAVAARRAGVVSVALASPGPKPSRAALKWSAAFIALTAGWPVLLMDPQTALIADPSQYFARDSDVESATDGWDDTTAYGYDHVVDDPAMDWSRYCHGGRVLSSDPGFALLMPTAESAAVAALVAARTLDAASGGENGARDDLDAEHEAFNEAIFLPSHGAYTAPGVMRRTLNYLCFANSKALFRFIRKDQHLRDPAAHTPVAVRLSYHAQEPERLEDVYLKYLEGKGAPLGTWSDGNGKADGSSTDNSATCKLSVGGGLMRVTAAEEDGSPIAQHLRVHRDWSWGGVTPFTFNPAGDLSTPWGKGDWGLVPARGSKGKHEPRTVWARFVGSMHVLTFEDVGEGKARKELGMFVSERCADGDMVVGRFMEK